MNSQVKEHKTCLLCSKDMERPRFQQGRRRATMKFRTDIYGIIVDVEYTYHHAYRGQRDGNVGPPLEPDEPRHCEIDSVTTRLGDDITNILSDKIIRQLELEAEEVYFNVEE